MDEIQYLDGKVMRPLFKLLRRTWIGDPILALLYKGLEYYSNGFSTEGRYGIKRVKWSSFGQVLLTGQSHLDAAWRWRTKQGIIKARATFKKALDHIEDPTLPYFTFSQPSPCYYDWMKTYYPDLYVRLKKAVANGRFIPIGGMWVEADCNIPSGEAMVRQRLYGQRYYLKEFGMISDVEFLQDVFGFNRALPQILKKSGAKMFGTGKIFWNETEKIPIGMCHWQSPDGTKLPMIHIHFGYFMTINYGKEYPLIYLLGKKDKKLIANYQTKPKEFQEWRSRELMLDNVFGYGLGDGGHGPIELEVTAVEYLRKRFPKKFKHHQKGDFYALFKKYFDRWATWTDEWYLDIHRGTYTSVSRVKRGNRDGENMMESCEKLATVVSMMNWGELPSRDELEKNWKIVLYNQFHDILPGSSCPEVYLDYDIDLRNLKEFMTKGNSISINSILNNIKIDKKYGIPFILFNSLSWDRRGIAELDIGQNTNGIIRDKDGNELPTKIVKKVWGYLDRTKEQIDENIAIFEVNSMPSTSINLYYYDQNTNTTDSIPKDDSLTLKEINDSITVENKFIKAEINKKNGLITKIFSNTANKNLLSKPSNKILIFSEERNKDGGSDAWNLHKKYMKYPVKYDENDCNISVIEDNSLRKTVEITRKIDKSLFIQRISLSIESPVLIFEMEIDLKNPYWLVKTEYNLNLKTNEVTSEISYSFIDRTIIPTTKLDKARWEHSCQKFISVLDESEKYSVTLMNNGKYGYNALKSDTDEVILRPTIVRSSHYTGYAKETMFVNRGPDGGLDPNMPQNTDIEHHKDIKYGLFVDEVDWRGDAWRLAYELNYPLREKVKEISDITEGSISSNQLPLSFLKIEPKSVQIGTFKIGEDDSQPEKATQYIIRLIEREGKHSEAFLSFNENFLIKKAEIVDLLELNPENKNINIVDKHSVKVSINPYEIITLKISTK